MQISGTQQFEGGHPKREVEGCCREVGVGSRQAQTWTSTTLTC